MLTILPEGLMGERPRENLSTQKKLVVTNLVPTSTISDIGGTKFDTYDTILMLSWYLKVQDLIPIWYLRYHANVNTH